MLMALVPDDGKWVLYSSTMRMKNMDLVARYHQSDLIHSFERGWSARAPVRASKVASFQGIRS